MRWPSQTLVVLVPSLSNTTTARMNILVSIFFPIAVVVVFLLLPRLYYIISTNSVRLDALEPD